MSTQVFTCTGYNSDCLIVKRDTRLDNNQRCLTYNVREPICQLCYTDATVPQANENRNLYLIYLSDSSARLERIEQTIRIICVQTSPCLADNLASFKAKRRQLKDAGCISCQE